MHFIILADAQECCRQHQCQQHSDHLSLFFHIYNSRLSQLFLPSAEPDHESGDHTADRQYHGNQQPQQQNLCGIHYQIRDLIAFTGMDTEVS